MKVDFLKKFYKDLDKITSDKLKNDLKKLIMDVEASNQISEIKNLKKLEGFKNAYRIKTGDYRIGVFIEEDTIEFVRFVHRKDIYKKFP